MFIKNIIRDFKTYLSIKIKNRRRFAKSKVDSYIHDDISIGDHCTILNNVTFSDKFKEVGTGVYIGKNTSILNCKKIGNYSSISYGVALGLDNHYKAGITTSPLFCGLKKAEPTVVEEDVLISINASIIAGVKLGRGCIVGAHSFVNKSVPPYAIVAGVPAKVIGYRFQDNIIEMLNNSEWWNYSFKEISAIDPKLRLDPVAFLNALNQIQK